MTPKKPKKPRGPGLTMPKIRTKPTSLTPELLLKIQGAIEAGLYPENAMLGLGIGKTTINEWKQKGRAGITPYCDLIVAIEESEAKSFAKAEKQLAKLVSKGDLRAITWFLERRLRAVYKPNTHELSGPSGGAIEASLVGLSTDELLKLATPEDTKEGSTDDK